MTSFNPAFIISTMVGLVFLSEGIQKFLFPEITGAGRFERIGVFYPHIMGYVIGAVEIVFGSLLLLRFKIRFTIIPLLCVMAGAIYYTKLPQLFNEGFWKTAHAGRTDFLMTCSLIFLLITSLRNK